MRILLYFKLKLNLNMPIRILFLLFFGVSQMVGQQSNLPLIVKTKKNIDFSGIKAGIRSISDEFTFPYQRIAENSDLYRISVPAEIKTVLLRELASDGNVLWAVEDIPLNYRLIPDDAFIEKQWHLEKIDAFKSWDITTGGLTPDGDTIVVAVIDDGFMPAHVDLRNNTWKNYREIPGDGLDNDNNGYTDDFEGLNIETGKDNHPLKTHGTSTAGLIGASGNNGTGISGISWNVKLMLISEATSAGNVIEAYEYVLAMRKLYNETNGAKGAYVVATNLSAGIDNAFPQDNPLFQEWCSLYDQLGEAGVLNVNAVPNVHTDIDVKGDMPSTCNTPYLIRVTMTDQEDVKDEEGAFGKVYVNLAAPGREIYSTTTQNQYAAYSGTSTAAPLVSGTIGLLYAAPCMNFAELAGTDPVAAGLAVRSMILEGVDVVPALGNFTSTSGRLNILGAFTRMRDFCEGSSGELNIGKVFPNPAGDFLNVGYETDNYEYHRFNIYNVLGQSVLSFDFYPPFFGEKKIELDLTKYALPMGIYIVSIRSGSKLSSRKIMLY